MDMADNLRRFKSELEAEVKGSSNVFIVGHNEPDFDAIGSAMGLYVFTKKHGKKPYIIIDDEATKIEPGVRKVIDDSRKSIRIINKREFLELTNPNSLLIITDVNKKEMVSVSDSLDKVNKVVVIDHHHETDESIKPDLKYINLESSSASEIVSRILNMDKIKYDCTIANYLLAGISLDTDRFKKNTTALTHDVAEKLIKHGADMNYVNTLFLEDFESFCRVASLVIYENTIRKIYTESLAPTTVSFSLNRTKPHEIYQKEDCAKAADRMMKFIEIDASFVMGYVDQENVHISARGGNRVNVGKIMESVGGGGNYQNAGAKIKTDDIFALEELLMDKVPLGISNKEEIIETPQVVKTKRYKKRILNRKKI